MNIVIRLAKAEDRASWVQLRSQLWPSCPPERHRLEIDHLMASSGLVAVACVHGELVGFAEGSIRLDHVEGTSSAPVPYLEGWYVTEAYRGRGVGRALLTFVERWARESGYRELASDAEIENETSIRLHSTLGFNEVSRTVHFVKSLSQENA